MTEFERFAVYYLPPAGAFAAFGAAWLGWDAHTGQPAAHPQLDGLPQPVASLTQTPRKYGFHGTIKPPFRLAEGTEAGALLKAARVLCAAQEPAQMPALRLAALGRFVALVPEGDTTGLARIAAAMVEGLDSFRAPPSMAELARRRQADLSRAQESNLKAWGYPYVMDEFRFHMTLTGQVPQESARDAIVAALAPRLEPLLPRPFVVDTLCLAGSDAQGRFRLIERLPLGAGAPGD